jgi:hypothetical protein
MKLLIENWKKFLSEQPGEAEPNPQEAEGAEEKFFVILLGGSGTGKGALVGTNRAIGELQKLMGQSIGRPVKVGSADAIESGEAGARVVFEPDRVLRVHQWHQAKSDFERMKKGEEAAVVLGDLKGEESLRDAILTAIEAKGGIEGYASLEDYAGQLQQVGGAETPEQALAMSDALGKGPGDDKVKFAYKQMRRRPFKGSDTGIKATAVAKAKEEMKGVVGQAKSAADSFILDSAGEDLAEQDVVGELQTAKEAGFSTAIVLLATGAVQSYLGNMERAVARGGRNVDAAEIMKFYNVLIQKHNEFGVLMRKGLLDEYIVLEQDPISPEEIEDLTRAICNPGELLGIEGIPDVAGNEIEGCIPQLADPSYLPDEEETAAKTGATSVEKDSPNNMVKNWDQAFDTAAKAGALDKFGGDPAAAKKQAMLQGLYPKFQDARSTGEAEILRPINAKSDFKTATAVIAKALKVATQASKMKVAESKIYKRWKILIG